MIYVDAGAGETRDSVDGGAGDNQWFQWMEEQETTNVEAGAGDTRDSVDGGAGNNQWFQWMEEQETTNDFSGWRSRKNQGFRKWSSRRKPMISADAGADETRDSVDGGAGDNQWFMWKQEQRRNQGFCRWRNRR
jgi:hypothetical protein